MRTRLPALLVLLLSLVMAACGARTSTATTATASSTAMLSPTSSATSSPVALSACSGSQALFGHLAYPAVQLPDSSPLKPMAIDPQKLFGQDPPTNLNLAETLGGYVFAVCNTSSTVSYTITGVSVRINQLAPYSGSLNAWNSCDGVYRSGSVQDAGCGGGPEFRDEYLHASFPANATNGASISAKQTGSAATGPSDGSHTGPLPIVLGPGKTLSFNVGLTPPQSSGIYTFAFGVVIGSAAPVYIATSKPTLLAPVAHKWTGSACKSPAMQSQIPPPTNPPTSYICPEA